MTANAVSNKVFAVSENRYRASAAERRAYGGKTVTEFLVGFVGSDAATWVRINGYGPTPGERKSFAIASFLKLQANADKAA
jgi:hypothetical protein